MNILIYIYCYCYYILFWWNFFIPSRKLNEVFTYNYMALISRSRSNVKPLSCIHGFK